MENNDLFVPTDSQLTVLSFGAGQDSSAMLEMYLGDSAFRQQYAPKDFLVLMSDTGDEFDPTYEHVAEVQHRCQQLGVEFVLITPDMGYHSESWQSLRHFYRTHGTIGSKAFPKTCTDRLKIQPIYRFLEHWLSQRYGVQCNDKKGLREFAATFGKIQMLLGFAKGEEKRVSQAKAKKRQRWFVESVKPVYPLVEIGMDRKACQNLLHDKGMRVIPSNCKACPFLALEELEYLRRFYPHDLQDWMHLEAAKLEKYKHMEAVIATDKQGNTVLDRKGNPKTENKNYGVFGVKPLPVKIQEAKKKFAHWTDWEISDYRYSHGHCVASTY